MAFLVEDILWETLLRHTHIQSFSFWRTEDTSASFTKRRVFVLRNRLVLIVNKQVLVKFMSSVFIKKILCDADVSLRLPLFFCPCVFPPDTSRTASQWKERIWNTTLSGCSWLWRWSASYPPHVNSKMSYVMYTTVLDYRTSALSAGIRVRSVLSRMNVQKFIALPFCENILPGQQMWFRDSHVRGVNTV